MKTTHRLNFADSRRMEKIKDQSVDLVVTSPPYPMIAMWDESFARQSHAVRKALGERDGGLAFEAMHRVLDPVWNAVVQKLKPGGFACINIGDATRQLGANFMLYPNHARILTHLHQQGLSPLPAVLWRKQTNAPNKFMGSGMLPAGAYVTLEHEYILILRKGGKRAFDRPPEKEARRRSAIFWEERNLWYSDVWTDLKGARQQMLDKQVRARSGAFPLELPYRLINMYSVAGDTVLDPFLGAGTTLFAAMAAARNSIGFELEADFVWTIREAAARATDTANRLISDRLERHATFVAERQAAGKELKYESRFYGFPVVTRQETEICFNRPIQVDEEGTDRFTVSYLAGPPETDRFDGKHPGPGKGQPPEEFGPSGNQKQQTFNF